MNIHEHQAKTILKAFGAPVAAGVAITDLQWLEPVRPGHTLTYTYEITDKPDRVIREKWGLIRSRNEAFNQYGNKVMQFEIDILAERRPA